MTIVNLHERYIAATRPAAGALVDSLASGPGDRLWPWERWPALRLDGPLAPGAQGGHGPIRYHASAYEPGRSARFVFAPATGIDGSHAFEVVDLGAPDRIALRHILVADAGLYGRLRWAFVIRWLHDALIEDALDKAERALTGTVQRPARWSAWVRILRRVAGRRLMHGAR